ncbi:MAG TPA: thioredoxin fold domain-containing protein [Bacteroidales bacterium]|jgi:thioredoxin 1|nr:thioredoxin fold domain-containing protein [Bacteroidales bacterium]
MKYLFFTILAGAFLVYSTACTAGTRAEVKTETIVAAPVAVDQHDVIALDDAAFVDQVFDYRNNTEWAFKGERPAIIDFYADWCGPCKRLAPILVELQKEYGDKIQIYKVDAERNRELAAAFGVTAYPTMLFIPMDGDPAGARGLLPKEELERIIGEFLKVSK